MSSEYTRVELFAVRVIEFRKRCFAANFDDDTPVIYLYNAL